MRDVAGAVQTADQVVDDVQSARLVRVAHHDVRVVACVLAAPVPADDAGAHAGPIVAAEGRGSGSGRRARCF